jgi:hypothetical protein
MKDKQQSPEFPTNDYVRPNQDWVCGHLCKGKACRIGPSPKGKCRATYECVPLLEVNRGETKGHWICTRPRAAGGKCEKGPLPDGTCCNAIPKCQPRRTLRAIRKRVTAFTVIASCLVLFAGIDRSLRDEFINPGPVSSVHASEHFSNIQKASSGDSSNCAACHASARQDSELWHTKVRDAFQGGLAPRELIKKGPVAASEMDANCLACHAGKDFHQPNMVAQFACHACHKEHEKSDFMPEVTSDYCLACHASAELMAKSRELAAGADPHAFPSPGRPTEGYTEVIHAFHDGHPEFRLIRSQSIDLNPLKFNHSIHLKSGDVQRGGEALSCKDCHESDAKGEYQLPITYEKHCAECHALQFDPTTSGDGNKPGLVLPHGDPFYVRSFLRSLSIQYEEYARTHEGITLREPLKDYVERKRASVESLYETGEFLERSVFFADMKGQVPGGRRAPFAGCATCHEVSEPPDDNAAPLIAKVSVPKRWMEVGKFNHELHRKGLTCVDCHDVMNSERTSDINLPSIKSCVDCHSPKGGIDHRCVRCHTYHNSRSGSLFDGGPEATPESAKERSGD